MKLFDKFLKVLNVSRNTFFTYILTLITIYLAVDRIVEMMLMIFTGVASSYWGPIGYTLAIACPVFAFAFSGTSSFSDTRAAKVSLFYVFLIGFYIIVLSLFVQHFNMLAWILFVSSPSYVTIATEFSELIRPAFCAISLYIPLVTVYPFIKFILLTVDDTTTMIKSLWDFKGIDLSAKKSAGPYACNLSLFKDFDNGKQISMVEKSRYQSTLVCGTSGSGKTALIFEPIIAQDIEKKFFYTEVAKDLGFTALKTGIASLSTPYSNEYVNKHFSLNMLSPSFGKDSLYNTFVSKMVLSSSPEIVYKDIGITYMSPDYETLSKMMNVCDNYNVGYNLIDPSQPQNSVGLNPFVYENPSKIAVIISSTLQGISSIEPIGIKDSYKEEASLQIIENLAILLKVMYPRMNNGVLPNMEDLLKLLSNFALVEKMCKILENDEELADTYQMELSYFKRSFYANAPAREETEKISYYISSKLENLLRSPQIRLILCNRRENINFDNSLKNGEVTFICTRRGESGKIAHKAFGLFFLLSMQNSILSRPGNEKSRIPHFLYIDEFPDFLTKDTELMFTMYRKYKVAITISAQSISQFNTLPNQDKFNSVILGNCGNKIYTGGSTPMNELEWWEEEIGKWKEWAFGQDFDGKTNSMSSTLKDPKKKYAIKMSSNRIKNLGLKRCAYRILDAGGKATIGEGMVNFLNSKYKEKHSSKSYNFEKFSNETPAEDKNSQINKSTMFNHKNVTFKDDNDEINPVQNTQTKYSFDNEDGAIVIDLKNNPKNSGM